MDDTQIYISNRCKEVYIYCRCKIVDLIDVSNRCSCLYKSLVGCLWVGLPLSRPLTRVCKVVVSW